MILTRPRNITLMFENGYELSISNGFGSYSDNQFAQSLLEAKEVASDKCEIAVLKNNKFVTKKVLNTSDDVVGFVSSDELAEIIMRVKNYGRN